MIKMQKLKALMEAVEGAYFVQSDQVASGRAGWAKQRDNCPARHEFIDITAARVRIFWPFLQTGQIISWNFLPTEYLFIFCWKQMSVRYSVFWTYVSLLNPYFSWLNHDVH
jgi:hypothetical protein